MLIAEPTSGVRRVHSGREFLESVMSTTSGDNNSPPMVEELAFLRESVGDRYIRIALGVQSQTPTEPRTIPNTPLQQPSQNENTQGSRMSQRVNLDIDHFQSQNSGSHNTSNSLPTPPPDQCIPSQDAFGELQGDQGPSRSAEFPVSTFNSIWVGADGS